MSVKIEEKDVTVSEVVVTCPFCQSEMSDLGTSSQPVVFESESEEESRNVVSGLWRIVHEYVCHGCEFWAKFWETFSKKKWKK